MNNIKYKTLANGLTLCLIQKKDYVCKQAMLAFGCGSANIDFKTIGGNFTVPKGTAHFVEHKLFDKKHGNVFDSFSQLGANVNAFTGLDITAYYFSCMDNFEKCLSLLAQMAITPYFTQKNVIKELGIIGGEITMYDDDPFWQSHFGMLGGLYGKHPIRSPIAGAKEDIAQITPEHLTLFYDNFYTADNAILVAAGDIDEDSFFEQAEKEFTLNTAKKAESIFKTDIPVEDVYVKQRMSVATPVFSIGFKEDNFGMPMVMRRLTSKLIMEILLGKGSVLYEKLFTASLCSTPPSFDYICGKSYGASVISGVSQNPERLLSQLHSEISNYLNYGISQKNLQRVICKSIGLLEQNMDSIDFCCNFVADNFVKSIKTLDISDKYDSINTDELLLRLETHFRSDNLCMSEVVPI